jgi:hypothetical protein
MFYVYLLMLWAVVFWAAGYVSDLLFAAYNYGKYPFVSATLAPLLLLIWALFGAASVKLLTIAINHFTKTREKKFPSAPVSEVLNETPTQESK